VNVRFDCTDILTFLGEPPPPKSSHELVKTRVTIFCFTAADATVLNPNGLFLGTFFPEFEVIILRFEHKLVRYLALGANIDTPNSFAGGATKRPFVSWFTGTATSGRVPVNVPPLLSTEVGIDGGAALQLVQDAQGQWLYRVR